MKKYFFLASCQPLAEKAGSIPEPDQDLDL
jgi:hypothetical protein